MNPNNMRWRRCLARLMGVSLLSVTCLIFPVANAQDILPIGVKVELAAELTLPWSDAEKIQVINNLTSKLVEKLNDSHRHWQFRDSSSANSPAALVARAISRGANEIVLEIELQLYAPANSSGPAQIKKSFELSQL